jgi:hypothetical protein
VICCTCDQVVPLTVQTLTEPASYLPPLASKRWELTIAVDPRIATDWPAESLARPCGSTSCASSTHFTNEFW